MFKPRLAVAAAMLLGLIQAQCQTCVPTNGFLCTPNLNLNLPPQHYTPYNVPVNENFQVLDQFAGSTTMSINTIFGNTPTVAVVQGKYPDLGAALNAVDTAYAGKPAVFQIPASGNLGTAWHLSNGHFLQIYAPIQESVAGTVGSQAGIDCISYANSITSTLPAGSAMIQLPVGTVQTGFSRCRVESYYNTFVNSPGYTQDVTLERNYGHDTGLYQQQSAGADAPTLRFRSLHNTANFDITSAGVIGEVLYGATQDSEFDGDSCKNTAHCHELYSIDGGSHPTAAQVAATGLRNDIIRGTTCETVFYACDWASGGNHILFESSTSVGAGDVSFDLEASINSLMEGIDTTSSGAGCYSLFFRAVADVITGNRCTSYGAPGILIKNDVQADPSLDLNTQVTNNTYIYAGGGVGVFMQLDSNQGLVVQGNNDTDGAFVPFGYSVAIAIKDNSLYFDQATSVGLGVPLVNNGRINVLSGNTIQTLIPQAAGSVGIIAQNIDFNSVNTFVMDGNKVIGWPVDIQVSNSGGNVPADFSIRNSLLSANLVQIGTSNAGVRLHCSNNYTINGDTPVTCPPGR